MRAPLIGRAVWSAFVTYRHERIRIISVRRARPEEKARYLALRGLVSAARLDTLHDAGADLTAHLDLASGRRPGHETQRVNVDFPVDLLSEIDREARRLGVTRQAFIKLRVADALPSR